MENLKLFLKENKIKRENVFYPLSDAVKDESGKVVLWEIRHITTEEDEMIRDECLREAKGRNVRIDYNLYLKRLATESVVFPPLNNAQLQDSYGVRRAEDLLLALLDKPGEYQELLKLIQRINGFDKSITDKVEEAKN